MTTGYTFNNYPIIVAMQHIKQVAPGTVNIYALSFFASDNSHHLLSVDNNGEIFDKKLSDENDIFTELRKHKKTGFQWFAPSTIPFRKQTGSIKQMEIFDEDDNTVLCLRIENNFDFNQDLLFAEFRRDTGIFGMQTGETTLNTQSKTLIGNLLSKSVASVCNDAAFNASVLNETGKHTWLVLESAKQYKTAVLEEQKMHRQSIECLAKVYIEKLSQTFNRTIILSEEAIDLLWQKRELLQRMHDVLSDAVNFALNISSAHDTGNLIIYAEMLHHDNPAVANTSDNKKSIISAELSKQIKIEQYLYLLQESVNKLIAKQIKVTGKSVGAYREPPISAAAITAFVMKHQSSITRIIKDNPTKWKLLSEEFSTVQNAVVNQRLNIKKTS